MVAGESSSAMRTTGLVTPPIVSRRLVKGFTSVQRLDSVRSSGRRPPRAVVAAVVLLRSLERVAATSRAGRSSPRASMPSPVQTLMSMSAACFFASAPSTRPATKRITP